MRTHFGRLGTALLNRVRSFSLNRHVWASKHQLVSGYLPDPDFELFEHIEGASGLVVDIGAHRGHCALTVLSRAPHLSVIAFEPNPALRPALEYIRGRFPDRFQYHQCALGARTSTGELLVPTAGRSQTTTNASMRKSEFEKDYVQERVASELGVRFSGVTLASQEVEVRTLDSFDLEPSAIKIDVEGLEREVIEGAHRTINRHKPMLMIEMNNHMEFLPLLESWGYRSFRFDPASRRMIRISTEETYLNVICLHVDRFVLPRTLMG